MDCLHYLYSDTFNIIYIPFAGKLMALIPECESMAKYNRECPFCGMTTAFSLISQGRIRAAYEINRFSVFLYSFFIINTIVLITHQVNHFTTAIKNRDGYQKRGFNEVS